ncbi:S4 domain-containing protein, partial [Anaerovibrio slackiae]
MKMIFAADKAGERLDVFLTRMQPEFSRSHVQKLIASGNATVNQAVRKG